MNLIFRQNIIKKTVAYLILGVVGLLILNKAVFLHTHTLNDGTIVVHAHPFQAKTDSNSNNPHQHTKCGIYYFNQLSFLYSQLPEDVNPYASVYQTIHFAEKSSFYFENYHACLKNRAPPVT
jgi:hypothetical protein